MSKDIKIIDNFLPKRTSNQIKEVMTSNMFPWYYNDGVAYQNNSENEDFYFTHLFYVNNVFQSNFIEPVVFPLLEKLNPNALIRIKGNLYPRTEDLKNNSDHVDYKFQHVGAIYYVNSNNGYTILQDGTEIESIQNRLLIFDPSVPHRSTHCTDERFRLNINFNYF